MTNGEAQEKKKRGIGKYIGIGCFTLIVIAAICGFVAYRAVKGVVSGLVDEYTDTGPRALPQLTVSEEQARAVQARVDEFKQAVQQGNPVPPMALTGNDINVLINYHPDWKQLAGKVCVSIDDDKIRGQISFPLEEMSPILKGRYLNGAAVFGVQLAGGRLFVFLDSVEVKGKQPPQEFMQQLRSENLAKDVNMNENVMSVIEKLESISVANGRLIVVPKKVK